jgi:hypothetical protein
LNMPNKFYIGTCVKLCSIFSTCLKVSTTMILLTLKLPGIGLQFLTSMILVFFQSSIKDNLCTVCFVQINK